MLFCFFRYRMICIEYLLFLGYWVEKGGNILGGVMRFFDFEYIIVYFVKVSLDVLR